MYLRIRCRNVYFSGIGMEWCSKNRVFLSWVSCNSLSRSGWPQTQRATCLCMLSANKKNVCDHAWLGNTHVYQGLIHCSLLHVQKIANKFLKHLKVLAVLFFVSCSITGNRREAEERPGGQRVEAGWKGVEYRGAECRPAEWMSQPQPFVLSPG